MGVFFFLCVENVIYFSHVQSKIYLLVNLAEGIKYKEMVKQKEREGGKKQKTNKNPEVTLR